MHPAPSPSAVYCVECLHSFQVDDTITLDGFHVCAGCKPAAVARLARGEPIGRLWRKGRSLVITPNREFPNRCVRCNEPTSDYRVVRSVYAHHPALYLLVPLLPVYLIVAIFARKRVDLAFPMCPRHLFRRSLFTFIGIAAAIAAFLCLPAVVRSGGNIAISVCALVFAAAVPSALATYPVLRAWGSTATHLVLRGAGPRFLQSLPEWPPGKG